VTHPEHKDTLPIIDQYPNVLLLRTFSKAYGLASFRVGYAIGQPTVIEKLDPVRGPFNNTSLSQAVAAIALSDQEYIEACREANENGKKQYVEFCEKHNLKYFPSDTNFIFFDTKADSDVIFQELMKKGLVETDLKKRAEIYKEWGALINEELPYLFLNNNKNMWAVSSRVKNMNLSSYLDWTFDIHKVELAQ